MKVIKGHEGDKREGWRDYKGGLFFHGSTVRSGQALLIIEASRSHSETSHSVELLWKSDQPDAQTPPPDNTQHSRQTYIHIPASFEPSVPACEQLQTHCLTPQGHWDRQRKETDKLKPA